MKLLRSVSVALALLTFTAISPAAPADDLQSKAPAMVFIIRHAEKPMEDKDPNLSPMGYKRAEALPSLFIPMPGSHTLPRFPRPQVLFATDPSKHSNRPIETITPLSQSLHLKIGHDFSDLDFSALAKEVLSGKYAGKVVLICWHHGEIPDLLTGLGAVPEQVLPHGKWPDDVFGWLIELRYDATGRLHETRLIRENLMPDDHAIATAQP